MHLYRRPSTCSPASGFYAARARSKHESTRTLGENTHVKIPSLPGTATMLNSCGGRLLFTSAADPTREQSNMHTNRKFLTFWIVKKPGRCSSSCHYIRNETLSVSHELRWMVWVRYRTQKFSVPLYLAAMIVEPVESRIERMGCDRYTFVMM